MAPSAAFDTPSVSNLHPRRILIFRALQVGDLLCAVPALRALRKTFPDAHITLAGLPWASVFVQRFADYLDDFIPFPGHPLLPEQTADPARLESFRTEVKRRRIDLALQLHGSGEVSNIILATLSARRYLAFGAAESQHSSLCGNFTDFSFLNYTNHGHEIHRLLALVRSAAEMFRRETIIDSLFEDFSSDLEFPIRSDDIAELEGLQLNLHRHRYLCIHPGARDRSKCWPAVRFAQVADALSAETGMPAVLTGSAAEKPLADTVSAAMRQPPINAACDMSLGALAALIKDARLLICNDTAVSHVAAALKVPSVVIFRRPDSDRWAPTDSKLHRVVHDPEGLMPQAVLAAARAILSVDTD